MKYLYQITVSLLLTTLLAGCGFQPRGELPQLQAQLSPMQIRGIGVAHQFRRTLEDRLAIAGVSLATDKDVASVLQFYRVKFDRQTLSVDDRNKTVEYEISVRADFSLKSTQGDIQLPRQSMAVRRILFNPGTDLLGRTQEEELLRRDMYKELSNQLIVRLQHQAR